MALRSKEGRGPHLCSCPFGLMAGEGLLSHMVSSSPAAGTTQEPRCPRPGPEGQPDSGCNSRGLSCWLQLVSLHHPQDVSRAPTKRATPVHDIPDKGGNIHPQENRPWDRERLCLCFLQKLYLPVWHPPGDGKDKTSEKARKALEEEEAGPARRASIFLSSRRSLSVPSSAGSPEKVGG